MNNHYSSRWVFALFDLPKMTRFSNRWKIRHLKVLISHLFKFDGHTKPNNIQCLHVNISNIFFILQRTHIHVSCNDLFNSQVNIYSRSLPSKWDSGKEYFLNFLYNIDKAGFLKRNICIQCFFKHLSQRAVSRKILNDKNYSLCAKIIHLKFLNFFSPLMNLVCFF